MECCLEFMRWMDDGEEALRRLENWARDGREGLRILESHPCARNGCSYLWDARKVRVSRKWYYHESTNTVYVVVKTTKHSQGGPGVTHGGALATVVDSAMLLARMLEKGLESINELKEYRTKLRSRYVNLTPIEKTLVIEAKSSTAMVLRSDVQLGTSFVHVRSKEEVHAEITAEWVPIVPVRRVADDATVRARSRALDEENLGLTQVWPYPEIPDGFSYPEQPPEFWENYREETLIASVGHWTVFEMRGNALPKLEYRAFWNQEAGSMVGMFYFSKMCLGDYFEVLHLGAVFTVLDQVGGRAARLAGDGKRPVTIWLEVIPCADVISTISLPLSCTFSCTCEIEVSPQSGKTRAQTKSVLKTLPSDRSRIIATADARFAFVDEMHAPRL